MTTPPAPGGSAYFLSRQDINFDSESLQIEFRDREAALELAYQLNEAVTVEGGLAYSNQSGFAALDEDGTRTISGSSLTGRDKGVVVAGAKYRFNDKVAAFAENTVDLFGDRKSITEAYGVTYTPNARWTYTGGYEVGEISDPIDENFDREAISVGASYDDDDHLRASLKLEYRTEDGEGLSRDRASGGARRGLVGRA